MTTTFMRLASVFTMRTFSICRHFANHLSTVATKNSPLPPSVEKAYHTKCIELKRRLREVEETNDAARLRVHRLERSITKMRVERAILLDHLRNKQKQVAHTRSEDDDSTPTSVSSQCLPWTTARLRRGSLTVFTSTTCLSLRFNMVRADH